ncbi:MAG: sulfite exporter TauE/SafE family protein [Candidatus Omnitrophota bacterium]
MILYLILGLVTGVFGGFLGIGGATIVVPALVFCFGFSQHQAQGTILAAMIPPIGLLAAIRYYHAGNVNIQAALLIAVGFFVGGYFGARFVEYIPEIVLKKVFGVFLLLIAARMIFFK